VKFDVFSGNNVMTWFSVFSMQVYGTRVGVVRVCNNSINKLVIELVYFEEMISC